jgi:hypothetical protein
MSDMNLPTHKPNVYVTMYPAFLTLINIDINTHPSIPPIFIPPSNLNNPQKNTAVLPQGRQKEVLTACQIFNTETQQQKKNTTKTKHQIDRAASHHAIIPSPSCSDIPNTHIEALLVSI